MFSVSSTNLVLLSVMTLLCPGHQTKTIYVPGIKIKTHLCPEGIKPKLLYAPWASNQKSFISLELQNQTKTFYVPRASRLNTLCPLIFESKLLYVPWSSNQTSFYFLSLTILYSIQLVHVKDSF